MKLVPISQPDVRAKILQSKLLQNVHVPQIYKQPVYNVRETSNHPDVKAKLLRSKLLTHQKLDAPTPPLVVSQFGEQAVQTDFQEPEQQDGYLNQIRRTLLRRYVDHIDKAFEFLEHNKGYEWNDSGEITNVSGVNLIDETEKITSLLLVGKEPSALEDYSEETIFLPAASTPQAVSTPRAYSETVYETHSPPTTRSRGKPLMPGLHTPTREGRRLKKRGAQVRQESLTSFDRGTKVPRLSGSGKSHKYKYYFDE